MMPTHIHCSSADLFLDAGCAVGESPLWDARRQCLWWVDAGDGAIWQADLGGTPPRRMRFEPAPSFLALTGRGTLCVAAGRGWIAFDPETGVRAELRCPEDAPSQDWRLNDGVVDAYGRIWTGSIGVPRSDRTFGALYRFDEEGAHMVADDLLTQNGLAVSPDGMTLYLADSHPSRAVIWAYDFELSEGHLSRRRVFHACDGGRPDGAAMDVEGGYWFALIDGGQILRLDRAGRITHRVSVPVSRPTNVCFGGPDMTRCFVTSMRTGLDDAALAQQPEAGGVFSFEAPIAGAPVPEAGAFAELAASQHQGPRHAHAQSTIDISHQGG
jgi:L-arabinonolactonase